MPAHRIALSSLALLGLLAGASGLAVAAVPAVPAVATDEAPAIRNTRIVPPPTPRVTTAEERANERIVLQWHYEFFDLGHFQQAADKYLAKDFHQHDPNEASGRDRYAAEFESNGYVPKKPAERPPLIAVLADGDMVMTVIPAGWTAASKGNPEDGFIHCNLFRVKDGRITDMWVSADAAAPPKGK